MADAFVNRGNSKRGNYEKVIDDIAAAKICPFCPEHIHRIHPKPLEEKNFWLVTDNAYPYKAVKQHMLLVHKTHIESIEELTAEAWNELKDIFIEEKKKRNIAGGSILLRFGDTHFNGASVSHLHAQIVQGDPENADYGNGVICRVG